MLWGSCVGSWGYPDAGKGAPEQPHAGKVTSGRSPEHFETSLECSGASLECPGTPFDWPGASLGRPGFPLRCPGALLGWPGAHLVCLGALTIYIYIYIHIYTYIFEEKRTLMNKHTWRHQNDHLARLFDCTNSAKCTSRLQTNVFVNRGTLRRAGKRTQVIKHSTIWKSEP